MLYILGFLLERMSEALRWCVILVLVVGLTQCTALGCSKTDGTIL